MADCEHEIRVKGFDGKYFIRYCSAAFSAVYEVRKVIFDGGEKKIGLIHGRVALCEKHKQKLVKNGFLVTKVT